MDRTREPRSPVEGELLLEPLQKPHDDARRRRSVANAEAMSSADAAKRAGLSWNAAYLKSLERSGYSVVRITADELEGCMDVYWAAIPEEGEDAYPFPSAIV